MNLDLFKNSFLVSAGATLVSAAIGIPVALWAVTLQKKGRHFVMLLAVMSLALPSFLQTNCWIELLGSNGAWRTWFPLNIYSILGTVWVLSLILWPLFFGCALAVWSRIDASQIESDSALQGVPFLRHLLWPMARPSFLAAALLVFVLALNNFTVPALLQVKVFPAHVWTQFETNLNPVAALITSVPLIIAPLLLLFAGRAKVSWPVENALATRAFRVQLGGALTAATAAISMLVLLLSLALPIWRLAGTSRTWTELPGAATAVAQVLQNSLLLAALAAVACIAFGVLLSRWTSGRFLWLSFFVPGILLGIALISIMNRPVLDTIYRSAGIIVLAWFVRYVAIGWQTTNHALRSTDPNLVDAAVQCGGSRWAVFRFVRLPEIGPKLALGWYVIYLLCLWDVETVILILPPGGETLAIRIFGLLHYGHNAQVNALCLLLLALAVAPLLAWHLWKYIRSAGKYSLVLVGLLFFISTGCDRSNDPPPLESRLFRSVSVIGHRGAGAGEFNKPRSIALDRNDNLFVVDMTGRVQKFSPTGQFLLSWQMPQTDLGKPKGMCLDHDGNLVVVEPHYQRVNHFTSEGKLVAQWGKRGTNAGEMMLPRAVAVNSRGDLFIPEYKDSERVQGFSARDKSLILSIGRPGTGDGEFNRAEGIAIDRQDRIYIPDSCNHRIQVFGPDGKWLRTYGRPGKNRGEMSYPYDIRVDSAGNQYVCEFGNSRIQVFDSHDQPVEIIGGAGSSAGLFNNPWCIALDSQGNLYVCDTGNHRIQKFLRK